jgi:hypothetical protein
MRLNFPPRGCVKCDVVGTVFIVLLYVYVGSNECLYLNACKREDNIKIDLKKIECKDADWIHLAQDSV